MSGEGGSTVIVAAPDWALIELPMPEVRTPRARFSAFIEAPFDALEGVLPTDWLPIQGVAYDQAERSEYSAAPDIAFPSYGEPIVATVDEEKRIFSLLVDLTGFDANTDIRIGVYGYIEIYNLLGQLTDGSFSGTVILSEFYGSVALDISGVTTPQTPGQWSGLVAEDTVHMAFAGSGPFDILVSLFPELTGKAHVLGGFDPGQVSASFLWNHVDNVWEGDPALVTPDNNPDAFMVSTPAADITTYWAPTFVKSIRTVGMTAAYLEGETTPLPASSVVTPPVPPDSGQGVTVAYRDYKSYNVPTARFTNARLVPVNVTAIHGVNPWVDQAEHDTPRPDYSLTWETDNYPVRPAMVQIGTAVVPSIAFVSPASDDFTIPNHFGQPRIGTIIITRRTGASEIAFEPEVIPPEPPVDGTPDGDGPIGDGTAPGRTDNPQLRAWTFSLDGHDYYVLRLGDFDQLVYDTYSEQWMDWNDFDSLTWRAHIGANWVGAETLADTYGSNVLAGDDAYGLLWFLDPNQPFDDDPLGSDTPTYFSRVTVGQVPMRGRDVLPCYAAWLTTDMGEPAYSGAAVTLWTSDDAGVTWDNQGSVGVVANEAKPQLSWESLGQIEAPGRLFKIFDDGAVTRIDSLEMNDPDDEKASD